MKGVTISFCVRSATAWRNTSIYNSYDFAIKDQSKLNNVNVFVVDSLKNLVRLI